MYRIILADDEVNILEGMQELIKSFGLPVDIIKTAQNGEVALEYIKNLVPEIAILDINMPKLNGLDLIKEIREFNNDLKIIIISGYDDFKFAQTAIKLGVTAYLLKPIDDEEFYELLKKTCRDINVLSKNEKISKEDDNILSYVKDNFLSEELNIELLMKKFSRSRSGVYKIFKTLTGKGLFEYIAFLKLEYAKNLLLETDKNIKEISSILQYSDQHHFSKQFKTTYGISPKEFRGNNKK